MTINQSALDEINNNIKNSRTKLLIITKTRSIDDISELIKKGYRSFGENRVQEAVLKYKLLKLKEDINIDLHLVGPLQSNKVKQAMSIFDAIQSIDRKKLVDEILKNISSPLSITKDFFIQINIGNEAQKSGVAPNDLRELYEYCLMKKLKIKGLMCIPPLNKKPDYFFNQMKDLRDVTNKNLELSMGMSQDFKIAIKYDSNLIRVGSMIFHD